MAIPSQPCNCFPYSNLCCCRSQNGITVIQPSCQNLPDGSVVNNPAFVMELNKSFWTYKLLTNCDSETRGISGIGIPICRDINKDNINVEEKIDGCGKYEPVNFELIANDPNFGPAPEGYKFLKIETSDRFDKGLCVEYRISIIGDYPLKTQPISVKTATDVYKFNCGDCFIVPGCILPGKLVISKKCNTVIKDNQASIEYEVHVDNVGQTALNFVQFMDIIDIPTPLSLGSISVTPPTLSVDISVPGRVIISGDLGTINPGGRVTITYTVPIISISSPGAFTIMNMAKAVADGTEASDSCMNFLNAVKLNANKCCFTNNDTGTFKFSISSVGNSPDISVDILDQLTIPNGITLQFQSFNGCNAFFAGTLTEVPTNQDITGPVTIDIVCNNAKVPSGQSFVKTIDYKLVSSSFYGTAKIINSIIDVSPINVDEIIDLGTDNLPATATVEVGFSQICTTPCFETQKQE